MPAFKDMDMTKYVEDQERVHRALCNPAVADEILRFETWAADWDATRTFIDEDGDGFQVMSLRDAGDTWVCGREMAELMIAYYELPRGLYEKVLSAARQAGLRRRVAERRQRALTKAELKAQAEW
jgi:hypothetical protein